MHVRAKNASNSVNDWKFVWELHRRMVREWFLYLSPHQRLALLFVFDRTLGWGKEWERITREQCVRGIVGEDGVRYAAPFSSCPNKAGRILRSLVQLGVLRVEKRGGCDRALRYAVNIFWNPPKEADNPEMKLPKRLKQGGQLAPMGVAKKPLSRGAKKPLYKSIYDKKGKRAELEKELAPAGAGRGSQEGGKSLEDEKASLEQSVIRLSEKSKARSALKKMDGRFLRKDGTGFLPLKSRTALFWRDLWMRFYPSVPLDPLAVVSQNILWQYWKAWTEAREEGEFADYLGWVFENWNAIRLGTFAWMTGFPKAPAVRMITSAKLRPMFEEAYREKEAIASWRKLEPHERKLQELVENGMDPDKAREVVERQYATAAELAEIKASRKRLAVMIETFNRRSAAAAGRASSQLSKMAPRIAQDAPEDDVSALPIVPAPRKRSSVQAGAKNGALRKRGSFSEWKEDE